ncbi:M28 family peptidase [bacterium]|nr:M28 family peptidase [bacterium]
MKVISFSFLLIMLATFTGCKNQNQASAGQDTDTIAVTQVQFNADSAYASVVAQCDFGPRVPGSAAHDRCGDYIVSRFKALGLIVSEQRADQKAWDGKVLHTRNIIAAYRPELADRIIICTHWESRPWADADPDSSLHRQPVMAANDGASGVAVMLEVARKLEELKPELGIDFICFDSEDYGMPYWAETDDVADGSDWCLGSQHWAAHPHVPGYKARFGILLDMVGGCDARFCFEGISMRYASEVMVHVWDAAGRAGASQLFLAEQGGYAQDDHVPMNEVAGIPTIDIIPYVEGEHTFGATWHTTQDTPENISRETLKGVGQTLLQFLSEKP